jgi:hypothetical protein
MKLSTKNQISYDIFLDEGCLFPTLSQISMALLFCPLTVLGPLPQTW